MQDTQLPHGDETLPGMIAGGARSRSDGALVAFVIGGLLLGGVAAASGLSLGSQAAALGAALAAFGAWGICDRELGERRALQPARTHRALASLRATLTAAGAIAIAFLVFSLLHIAIGTWIS